MATTEAPTPDATAATAPTTLRRGAIALSVLAPVVIVVAILAQFSDASNAAKVGFSVALLISLMLLRVPVGIALAAVGVFGLWGISGFDAAANTMEQAPWSASASWSLSVVPMFILMGMLLERSGAAADIFTAVRRVFGGSPGSLAISTNFAGAALGAASGSTLGIAYALGQMSMPQMEEAGYDRRLTAAAVLMAGTGGQLIPPSILLVVYAGIAQVPVGQQLMAGFVPGIVLATAYAATMVLIAVVRPTFAPREERYRTDGAWTSRVQALGRLWPIALLIVVILGGLYGGIFTATEAGAYGVLASMVVAVALGGFRKLAGSLLPAAKATAVSTASVFLILIGGAIFGRFLAVSGVPRAFAGWLEGVEAGPVEFMLLVLALYLVLGMFMDPVAMMLITVPVLLPVASAIGIDPLVFGVFVVLLGELSVITPPVGILVFAVHGVAREAGVRLTLGDAFRGVSWFYPVTLLVLLSMIVFPDWVQWLPGQMG